MSELALTPPLARRQDALLMPRIRPGTRSQGSSADVDDTAEAEIVARLRMGDESAFAELIDRYGASMLRVAQMYVRDRATAEEVVQEA
jgi:DNA-directed RNA polymerase specialized sigma24 family protein